jgi:excisionase family DNA binding protein
MEQNELVMAVADEVVRRLEAYFKSPPAADPEYLTIGEVARRTSFSYDYIYDAVRNGQLPATQKSREWRVAVADMRAWMDRDRAGQVAPTRSKMQEKVSRLMPGLYR